MDKYVVVDLEMCKVPKQMRNAAYNYGSETIQIGAVLLDENYNIIDQFNTYVSPQSGQIDLFIHELTGISKADLKKAPIMKEALQNFIDWLPNEEVTAVSWSNADKKQIAKEIEARKINIEGLENLLERWIDCQAIYGEKLETNRCYKLSEALVAADICYEGAAHDGLTDARNTALLFAKLEKESKLQLNPIYQYAREEEVEHLQFSIGDLFSKFELKKCVCI